MARVLKDFNFRAQLCTYPWDQWLDGRIWQLSQGKDFECQAISLRQLALREARMRKGDLRHNTVGKDVVIQFVRKPAQGEG